MAKNISENASQFFRDEMKEFYEIIIEKPDWNDNKAYFLYSSCKDYQLIVLENRRQELLKIRSHIELINFWIL
jgi:hypothetical protein